MKQLPDILRTNCHIRLAYNAQQKPMVETTVWLNNSDDIGYQQEDMQTYDMLLAEHTSGATAATGSSVRSRHLHSGA
jgi:hypothetical protein